MGVYTGKNKEGGSKLEKSLEGLINMEFLVRFSFTPKLMYAFNHEIVRGIVYPSAYK